MSTKEATANDSGAKTDEPAESNDATLSTEATTEKKSEGATDEAAETQQDSNAKDGDSAETKAEDDGEKKSDMTAVVAKHYNELEEKGMEARAGSRIFYLRNFNNWTKSMLIGEFLDRLKRERGPRADLTVLDIGCGKGGDLLKWKKGNIKRLVCADIAEVSLEQCQQRYRDMSNRGRRGGWNRDNIFSAEFIAADCTKVRLKDRYKNPNIQFDLVSAQFSFHYCFESLQQAECMIRNASECLRPGGYFIGTTPDGHDIMRRLKEAPGLSFGNDVYSVTFESKDDLPLFGAQYNFHLEGVVDCPEFLVYFPVFEKIANDHGLKLVYKKRFVDFFEEFKNTRDGNFLLNRMQALETYPPFENEKALGTSNDDYEAAEKKVEELKGETQEGKSSRKGQPRVGTLSKSEWEAISMYLAFAFVKLKPGDDKKGSGGDTSSKKRKLSDAKSDAEVEEKRTKVSEEGDAKEGDKKATESTSSAAQDNVSEKKDEEEKESVDNKDSKT